MRTERSGDLLERDQSRESFNVRIGHTVHSASSQAKRAREKEREAVLFSSSPTTTPFHWRSINPLRFIFYHPRLTDFEEKNRRSVNRLRKILSSHHLLEKSFFSKISIGASERIKKSTHAVSPSRKINLFHTKDALTKAKRKGLSC